ncbi:MAG: 3-dehydroquinate synthase [Armatimonadota bacterium]|nr:3-dehydroquinate synthase [Armatimonadota bacterium]
MPTITVPLKERSYDIVIEPGALGRIDSLPLPNQLAVLSNTTVAKLYADDLSERLHSGGTRRVLQFNAPDGEQYKNLYWTSASYDALAEFGFTRRGTILAVGGGVVGDWAGFVAATWMRGVAFVQVPTTLLAMVDSSVGGKTGVNHPRAKNLIGAFHQPQHVVIDPECLRTLPVRELRAGLAEVIKYGVIADAAFFAWLEEHIEAALQLDMDVLGHIIARSCQIKAEVVGEDERESDTIGRRAILNYGHTVGHAIEATTAYGQLLHGEAISIGMTIAARLAAQLGICETTTGRDLIERQTRLFQRAGLPTTLPADCDFDRLWNAMTLDKKARGNQINFILPTSIGAVERIDNVPATAVRAALTNGH